MKKYNINVTQGDIVRCLRNPKYSPLQIAAARATGRDIDTVDVNKDSLYCWIYDDGDYILYTYEDKDLETIGEFIELWEEYKYSDLENFDGKPFNFNVEEKR